MSELSQALINSQRKLQLRQQIQAERSAIRYHAMALRKPAPLRPLARLWNLAPATLTPRKTPSAIISTLAVGLLTKRMGFVGKLLRLGVTLYPFLRRSRVNR